MHPHTKEELTKIYWTIFFLRPTPDEKLRKANGNNLPSFSTRVFLALKFFVGFA